MLNGLKRKIQNCMIERCVKEYEADLKAQQNAYDACMLKQEENLRRTYENKACNLTAKVVTKEEFAEVCGHFEEVREDVLIVVNSCGVLNPVAEKAILCCFEENSQGKLLYADEDVCIGKGGDLETFRQRGVKLSERCYPNLKPMPSPETFLSYQYLGNIWAVRTELCREIEWEQQSEQCPSGRQQAYGQYASTLVHAQPAAGTSAGRRESADSGQTVCPRGGNSCKRLHSD